MQLVIYGAKSFALSMETAIKELYPEYPVKCFLVSSLQGNPSVLAGLPVLEIKQFAKTVSIENRKEIHILICVPEDKHKEIVEIIEQYRFRNYTCMDSKKEARLMENYFIRGGHFRTLHALTKGTEDANIQVYSAKFYKDKKINSLWRYPEWVKSLQVGTELTDKRFEGEKDNSGDNISEKNVNYCELTALYWIWKNRLCRNDDETKIEYYGLFHYRRMLEVNGDDLKRIREHDVDVILPFPTLHEPDINEHHCRYIRENDWNATLQALEEQQPEYAKALLEIFNQPYFYNYNLIIAKKRILTEYCAWLFPLLERVEQLSDPKGWERADRYIGYIGESLMTLYFIYNQKNMKVYHTGRLMLI